MLGYEVKSYNAMARKAFKAENTYSVLRTINYYPRRAGSYASLPKTLPNQMVS